MAKKSWILATTTFALACGNGGGGGSGDGDGETAGSLTAADAMPQG